jgi:hypothetical protein
MSVFFPAGTFYEDFNLNFDVKNNRIYIHYDTVPVHSNFTITIQDNTYAESIRDKVFIGRVNGKSISYNSTIRKDNVYSIKSKTLGQYGLFTDKTPPTITIAKPIQDKWISSQKKIQFTINDNLSGIKSYNGYLNGKWILFEYDNKTKKITHNFDDGIVAEGANDLKIEVVDNVGNSAIFETRFFRSQQK